MAAIGPTRLHDIRLACPICGDVFSLHCTLVDDGHGRMIVNVDRTPMDEHGCPIRTQPYDGILSALS